MPSAILNGGAELEDNVQVGGCFGFLGLWGQLEHEYLYGVCQDADGFERCVFGE